MSVAGFELTGGFWVAAVVLAALVAFLWITNPKHTRTRRLLSPVLTAIVGALVRVGLKD